MATLRQFFEDAFSIYEFQEDREEKLLEINKSVDKIDKLIENNIFFLRSAQEFQIEYVGKMY